MFELERVGVLAARGPHEPRDLLDCELARGGDVEVLVQARRGAHRHDDPIGDVVHVRERPRLLTGAKDLQGPLAGEHLADQVGHLRARCRARRRAPPRDRRR